MKRKAITTSKKRVQAILRTEEARIRQDASEAVRRELTRFLVPEKGSHYDRREIMLTEAPRQPFVCICLPEGMPPVFDVRDLDARYLDLRRMTTVRFRAVRKCWSDGKGNIVNWYDWEFAGGG